MPFVVPLADARASYPEYTFIAALTPSEQKAAFHVRDAAGQDFCLKIIAPGSNLDRLGREIEALRTLRHPNIASLKEYVQAFTPSGSKHHIIEEFVHGDDLAGHLAPGVAWVRSDVAGFFAALSDGLGELKRANIVHRDLKPSNIRRRADGRPVIIDFGLARHLDLPDITNTHEGAGFGTPAYFAPEQFLGTKRDIDHRTDLFSLGIQMYEALVGKHPFYIVGMTMDQLKNAICTSDAAFVAAEFLALPKEWQTLLKKLLEKDRGKRLQSADQVATILRKIANV